MKKITLALLVLLTALASNSQSIVPRGTPTNTMQDYRLDVKNNLVVPRYLDTVTANLTANKGLDSSGALIKTYNPDAIWVRQSNPKRWFNLSGLSSGGTLATVATTGAYADLIGLPTIPAAQVQSDWNATTGLGVILNKPTSANVVAMTVATLRTTNTTTNSVYNLIDYGGGQVRDLGLNDGTYVDDTATHIISANGHVLERQFTAGRINASWFGVIGDGVTDNKIALQSAVTYAMNNGLELEITGKIRVTDQILITKAFKLIGVGSPSSDTANKIATILFDNSQVDGSGNATKSLFKIDEPVLYKLYNLSFENLSIIHRNQTPKNQHTFCVNGSNVTFWNINNVTVYNATGAIIYLKDGGTQYTPYAQQINWKNIKGYNVGGFLSQNGSNTWFVGGTIDNISLEQQINPVSPQPILCDFTGFLNITPRNIILEGNGNAAVTTCIKSTGHNMKFEDIWVEYVTNAPQYAFDIRSQTQLNHIVIAQGEIRAMGRFTAIDVTDLEVDQDVFNVIKLENGASITINKLYEQYTSDGLGVGTKYKIHIPDSLVGRVKIKDAVSFDGGTYSHNRVVPLFSLTKGVPFRVNQQINENFKVIPFGPSPSITSVLDNQEGRVIKVTPTSSNLDYLRFQVKVPPSFIGSSLTVGIRYKVQASNNTGNIKLLGIQSGSNGNGDNGVVANNSINYSSVNVLDKRGTWENGYLIVGQISDSVIVFELAGYNGITTPHTIYISDLKVQLGQDLPDLIGKVTDPVTWNDDQLPTSGYFVKGDIIYNTSPTDSTMGWRRLVTGLTNNLGTDWIEILPKPGTGGTVDFSYGIIGGIPTVGGSFPIYSKESNTSIAENVIIGAPVGQERTGGNLLTIKNGNTVVGGIAAADGNLTLPHISATQDLKVKNQYIVSETFTPEGNVAAPVGSLAIQSSTGDLAIKKTGTGTTGWQVLATQDQVDKSYTLSELRASNTLTNISYRLRDYGGGTFLDKGLNDGTHTDNTGVDIISANNHWLERQFNGMLDAKWFGVIGDGIHNDTLELNRAIAASTGRTLDLSGLTIKLDSRAGTALRMFNNVNLYADKARSAIIRVDNGADSTAILRINIIANGGLLDIRDQKIENITMFHNGGGKNGVEIVGTMSNTQFLMTGCNITAGVNGDAVYATNLSFGGFEKNTFSPSIFLSHVADGTRIVDNTFFGSKCAITLDADFGTYNHLIQNNVMPNRDGAIHIINGSQVKILNNQIEHALLQGVSQGNKLSHIWIEGRDYTSKNISILDNNGGGGTNLDHFLTVDNATNTYVDRNLMNATDSVDVVFGPLSFDNRVYPNNTYQGNVSHARPIGLEYIDSGANNYHPRTGHFITTADSLAGSLSIGATNYIQKVTGSSAISNSQLYESGTNVILGGTTPVYGKMQVEGDIFARRGAYGIRTTLASDFGGFTGTAIQSVDNAMTTRRNLYLEGDNVYLNGAGGNRVVIGTVADNGVDKLQVNGGSVAFGGSFTAGNSILGSLASDGIKANKFNTANSTTINPSISVYNDGSNLYGFDLGYNGGYRMRGVIPNTGNFAIATHVNSAYPTVQSDLTERFIVSGSGNVTVPTGTVSASRATQPTELLRKDQLDSVLYNTEVDSVNLKHFADATGHTVTGTLAETTVYSRTIPANTLGPNGYMEFKWFVTLDSVTLVSIYVGGNLVAKANLGGIQGFRGFSSYSNRGAQNVGFSPWPDYNYQATGQMLHTIQTYTLDTSTPLDLVVTLTTTKTAALEDFQAFFYH